MYRLLALLALPALVACAPQSHVPRSSGSLGLSFDDATLYVADADHERVTVIDTEQWRVVGHIAVGEAPERVLVTPDGTVYVTTRGAGTVHRVEAGTLVAAAEIVLGGEPVGMALSRDGQSLYVANQTAGTVSVLDALTLEARETWTLGGRPWAIALVDDDQRAYVTDMAGRDVAVVELSTGLIDHRIELEHPGVDRCDFGLELSRTPAEPADIIISPDDQRLYVAHVLSRTGTGNFNLRPGNNDLALAVAPSVSTLSTDRRALVLADEHQSGAEGPDIPAPMLVSTDQDTCQAMGDAMDAPSSLVVDDTGAFLYVADHNSNALAIVNTRGRGTADYLDPELGIVDLVRVGARPTGLAVAGGLTAAYVHSAFDYEVVKVENIAGRLVVTDRLSFATSPLTPEVERGRRLFFSAVDPRVTRVELGGVSCSSCHPDGGTDHLNWALPGAPLDNDLRGRNTPALWGVTHTAPYTWDGSVDGLPSVNHMMVGAMGGAGISQDDAADLGAWLDHMPLPRLPIATPALAETGARLFSENCASCHSGSALTDQQLHPRDDFGNVDTPSLVRTGLTAPYLRDGTAPTLDALLGDAFTRDGDRTFHDLGLPQGERAALTAWLRTR